LRERYPEIFACTINQVHDEMVFEVPADRCEQYTAQIGELMTECAEYFLMPFGIRGECSPAVGDVWLKD
jgi:DNA polymerase I-like protein with 3'-5' exonuclease and polymerase domains